MSAETQPCSLGILQEAPTQFDEPLYDLAAKTSDISLTVYYYGKAAIEQTVDPEIGRRVGWGGNAAHRYAAIYRNTESASFFLRRILRASHELVIVSGYNTPITAMAAVWGRLTGTPMGLRSDNLPPTSAVPGRYWAVKRLLYPIWFCLYATGQPASTGAARYLKRFGFSEERLFRFPYCMDSDTFARAAETARSSREESRAKWGLSPTAPVVCGVIKFSPREDPLTLVRAVLEARKTLPDLALLLVGDGPLRPAVEREAGDELGRSVILPGYLPYTTLPKVYAVSDLFVHPATGAWEVSVAEALSCGIPVIAADTVGSAEELIVPAGLGRVFPRGDWQTLAGAIRDTIGDQGLLARSRREGPAAVESLRPERALAAWRCAMEHVRRKRMSCA